jgi:hypothetical protein
MEGRDGSISFFILFCSSDSAGVVGCMIKELLCTRLFFLLRLR